MKFKKYKKTLIKGKEISNIEGGVAEVTPAPELDPEILKVLSKPPKKSKNSVDAGDYISELERGDDLLGTDEL